MNRRPLVYVAGPKPKHRTMRSDDPSALRMSADGDERKAADVAKAKRLAAAYLDRWRAAA